MEHIETRQSQDWLTPHAGRQCGTCYACCVYLGIVELKKHTGQFCKHLDGRIPEQRCTIYNDRPVACRIYRCAWLQGISGDDYRPDNCGVLVTPYPDDSNNNHPLGSLTMLVFDEEKAKPHLEFMVQQYLLFGITEIRVVNHHRKKGMYYRNGKIYACTLLPVGKGNYEMLSLSTDFNRPVGHYHMEERPSPAAGTEERTATGERAE